MDWSVGGTAGEGTDYEALGTSEVIPAGESSIDIPIVPIWNEIADSGSRTVNIVIEDGGFGEYTPGSSATISIHDDVDTHTRLIHQESFTLSGTSGYVNAMLDVTFTSPTLVSDPGTYTWVYQLQNPTAPTGTTTWTSFNVPMESTDDVNVLGPPGWTATVGLDYIEWTAASGGLAPGDMATFSFTTEPREVGPATVSADNGADVADLPTAPAPHPVVLDKPMVLVRFQENLNAYTLTLRATLAGDNTSYSTGGINFNFLAHGAAKKSRDRLNTFLNLNGWTVANDGDDGLYIAAKTVNGTTREIKSLTYEFTDSQITEGYPTFDPVGQITVGPY